MSFSLYDDTPMRSLSVDLDLNGLLSKILPWLAFFQPAHG
jgi:hypothetical protein